MRYMILMLGDQATMMEVKTPEWIRDMIAFMGEVNDDLVKAGELVDGQGLADPSQAKTVRFENGAPVATDGPYAETTVREQQWTATALGYLPSTYQQSRDRPFPRG
ncbi:MAG: hypothetical protein H0V79_07070 [Actinobacteria bacterium]|nr:hypothetical protein [Actinomycetota bacterium]MBA3737696.1 hypothetical protein [Actinomycetota bacterium]